MIDISIFGGSDKNRFRYAVSFGSIIENNHAKYFQFCFHTDTFEQPFDHSFEFIKHILFYSQCTRKNRLPKSRS